MSAKYINFSLKTEPLDDEELIIPYTVTGINVPSIKGEVVDSDEQPIQQNGDKIGSSLCVVNQVSSLVKPEEDSGSENIHITSSSDPSPTEESLNVAVKTEVDHAKTKRTSLKKAVAWEFAKCFKTFEAAIRYIDDGEYWSFVQQHLGDEGLKNYYRCSQGVKSKPQCPAQIYLLFQETSGNVLMCRSFDEHTEHIEIERKELGERVKEEINKLHDLNLKTAAIVKNLYRMNDIIVKPKYSQVDEYVQKRSMEIEAARQKYEKVMHLYKETRKGSFADKIKQINKLNCSDTELLLALTQKNKPIQDNQLVDTNLDNTASDSTSETSKQKNKKLKQKGKVKSKRKPDKSDDEEPPPRKKKDKRRHWILYQEYGSENDAKNAVKEDMCWAYAQQHSRRHGVKIYYRCQNSKRKEILCPASCCLFIHTATGKSFKYHTPDKHTCDLQNPTNHVLNHSVEEEIKKLHALGLRPGFIMNHLAKIDNIELPSEVELKSYLLYLDKHCPPKENSGNSSLDKELQQPQSEDTQVEKDSNKCPEVNNETVTKKDLE